MTTPILMYHSIGETVPRGFQRWVVRPAQFRAQVRGLVEAGYAALTVRALVAARTARQMSISASTREVVLTFDDGYADFLSHAAPVLRDYGMTATLFACPGLLGRAFNELPVLDWGAIAEAHATGFEIGAHSMSHQALDRLSPARALADVLDCKRMLEDRLGAPVTSFAYPFGFFTETTRQAVIAAGYTAACAVGYAFSPDDDDVFSLRRMIIRESDTCVDRLRPEAWLYRARSRSLALTRRLLTKVNGYAV
jgi:peptidoglycan/xylan/chitin deacetylase (PgdA/CDA1 family)